MKSIAQTWLFFKCAEVVLFVLALMIHDAYLGSLIDLMLMVSIIGDICWRIPND